MKNLYELSLNVVTDVNRTPKTGIFKNGLITLWKLTPSDGVNFQSVINVVTVWIVCSNNLPIYFTNNAEIHNDY